MPNHPETILSASRRTDIPAFYMDWFMDQIKAGCFTIKNPYNKTEKKVDATCKTIHTIVFWSKNFDSFLKMKAGEELSNMGYNLYFNFTINSESAHLEPHVPPLKDRLSQLDKMVNIFGPEAIAWRFDPICFFSLDDHKTMNNNLSDFPQITKKVNSLGINKCVSSFFDSYKKIDYRLRCLFKKSGLSLQFVAPDSAKKRNVIERMEGHLSDLGMVLHLCCEKEIISQLNPKLKVQPNACIDGSLLKKLFGGNPMQKRDYGQRSRLGCKCTKSIDIGSYKDHPCHHNCIFCYANPQIDKDIKTSKCH